MNRTTIESWLLTEQNSPGKLKTHTWCRQMETGAWQQVLEPLAVFFEEALEDARAIFERALGDSLNPLRSKKPRYPHSLPDTTKRGIFGEVLCGLFVEAMPIAGQEGWLIPAYLFRYHEEAGHYLIDLMNGKPAKRSIKGRTGDDFLAIQINAQGHILRFLVGEAKCHKKFDPTNCPIYIKDLSDGQGMPRSLIQLQRILEAGGSARFGEVIDYIDFIADENLKVPRSNLLVYVYDHSGLKTCERPRIDAEIQLNNFTAKRPFHVVEVHIPDAGDLVKAVCDRMYSGRRNAPAKRTAAGEGDVAHRSSRPSESSIPTTGAPVQRSRASGME